ncbi:MAG: oxidoreductase [Alphaproteobacteria bacterium]|nr:oxidoreductase [Alphaproteobacteria bacterium]
MSNGNWNSDNVPDQAGRVVLITGASSGIGKEAARVIAGKGGRVVIAARNMDKANRAAEDIRRQSPGAEIAVRQLDLSDLQSVSAFADAFSKEYDRLDVLINNAGIMMCPYAKTKDGFEIQMGTNHLGHFALTGHLLPFLKQTRDSRIVNLASIAHKGGNLDFSDLNWETRPYKTMKAYSDSKLANLYFSYHLASKLGNGEDGPLVTAAHPGWTATDLQRHSGVAGFLNNFFAQGVEMGTLPTLRAAFDENARQGDYFGPVNFFEMRGYPVKTKSNARSHDTGAAQKLWDVSEKMTGISY